MSLFLTPRQLSLHAEFYQRFGQLAGAGIGVVPALEHLRANPPASSYREPIERMLTVLAGGGTLTQALERARDRFPLFDSDMIQPGERSGRLDACYRLLAQHYEARSRMAALTIRQVAYPIGLLHLGVFLFVGVLPFAQSQFQASVLGLAGQVVLTLVPLYGLAAFVTLALQSSHSERWRAVVESIVDRVPLLGPARRSLALARLSLALEALVSAGVNLVEAWEIGARGSGSPAIRRTVTLWRSALENGRTPAQLVRESPVFPAKFSNLYATGEATGKLEESLGHLRAQYEEEGTRRLETFVALIPRLIYLAIVVYLAWNIVSYFRSYFAMIEEVWRG